MGNKKNLAVLATGSGKTYLACLAAYRLLNYTPTKRILFLVDRNNLARQTESEFSVFDRTEGQQKLGNLYTINRLKKEEDIKGDIVISTIQKLFCVLTGQKINDSDEDAEDEKAKADEEKDSKTVVDLGNDLKLPPDYFQLIMVDECHRSIYGKWKKVLDYFSGVTVLGLTATPTPEAYAYFNKNVIEEYISFPSSGYWTKKNMGKDVSNEIVEFSGLEDTEISLITKDAVVKRIRKAKAEVVEKVHTDVTEELDVAVEEDLSQKKTENIPKWPDGILDYLDATERNKVLEYACNLQISQSTRLHKMLVQYKKDIADYKSKLKEAQSRPYYNPRHNKPENEPAFFKEMSDECMSRAIAILDTVFKSIESLGGSINSDLSVRIRGDIVRFRMVESQDQVKHEMTKQEAQALVKYNDDIKNHRWASKPQIRKYDKVYNGKLRIVFGERSYIRDNDSEKLEDRLGDILVTLYEKAEENRIVREAREEAERKRVEEARRREENRQRKEQEIRLVKELVNKAEDYRIAKEIREYIQAMIDSGNEDITPAWIEWARKKADWYDPSIATEDEYLGKRQHEKNAEEKEKSLQDSIRKSWYW